MHENLKYYGELIIIELQKKIDLTEKKYREWNKVDILIESKEYIQFLSDLLHSSDLEIINFLKEFKSCNKFKEKFYPNLTTLENQFKDYSGDLRLHSLSIYCAVRAVKPSLMIETGVASGKSSSLALLAMEHNNKGKLISIDLPNKKDNLLSDGSITSTLDQEVGWMVPDYLRHRWDLILGDSLEKLPKIAENTKIDIFFHDSLHTKEHTMSEIEIIKNSLVDNSLILVDDIDMGAGEAFDDFLGDNSLKGSAFRDFAGIRFNG